MYRPQNVSKLCDYIHEINSTVLPIKASLLDCCVMPTDAWRPQGGFGVLPNPQNNCTIIPMRVLKNDPIIDVK